MSVISDKANILITNEDFSELMAENARLQAELAEETKWAKHYRAEAERLTERVGVLEEALSNCIKSWGDYVPSPRSRAAKALRNAQKTLEDSHECK